MPNGTARILGPCSCHWVLRALLEKLYTAWNKLLTLTKTAPFMIQQPM